MHVIFAFGEAAVIEFVFLPSGILNSYKINTHYNAMSNVLLASQHDHGTEPSWNHTTTFNWVMMFAMMIEIECDWIKEITKTKSPSCQ